MSLRRVYDPSYACLHRVLYPFIWLSLHVYVSPGVCPSVCPHTSHPVSHEQDTSLARNMKRKRDDNIATGALALLFCCPFPFWGPYLKCAPSYSVCNPNFADFSALFVTCIQQSLTNALNVISTRPKNRGSESIQTPRQIYSYPLYESIASCSLMVKIWMRMIKLQKFFSECNVLEVKDARYGWRREVEILRYLLTWFKEMRKKMWAYKVRKARLNWINLRIIFRTPAYIKKSALSCRKQAFLGNFEV